MYILGAHLRMFTHLTVGDNAFHYYLFYILYHSVIQAVKQNLYQDLSINCSEKLWGVLLMFLFTS